jgi:nucleoside-diphosphate-sugar epimerase
MAVLVTGCAGFIGSQLTESLLADGVGVVGVDCFNDNYGRPRKLRNLEHARDWDDFDFVPIDLARGDLNGLVGECEAVFHLAAEPGVRASWADRFESYLRNNVLATQRLLEAARTAPEKRFVFASSSSIYGQAETFPTAETVTPAPVSPYGMTKLSGEHLCAMYHASHGVETVSLRLFSVYGPRQRPDMAFSSFCRAALEDTPIELFGNGSQTRDFTYVSDVVLAARAAGEASGVTGRAFNVGGGSRTSLREALGVIEELAGRGLDVREHPAQPGDVRDTAADIGEARRHLAYEPHVALADGLRAEWDWAVEELSRPTPAA